MRQFCWLLATSLAILSAGCSAPYLLTEPGKKVQLKENEGLLALRLKFDGGVDYVEFHGEGKTAKDFTVRDPKPGYDLRILKLVAGTYCVSRFGGSGEHLEARSKDDRLCVEVLPGTLNYPGDFLQNGWSVKLSMNHKTYINQLQLQEPQLFKQFILTE